MVLGKPTIVTNYSGNLDFCSTDNCLPVPYELVPVGPNEYPHWQNQVWADADIETAANHMVALIDHPEMGRQIGANARAHLTAEFSFLSRGIVYAERCAQLLIAENAHGAASSKSRKMA